MECHVIKSTICFQDLLGSYFHRCRASNFHPQHIDLPEPHIHQREWSKVLYRKLVRFSLPGTLYSCKTNSR